MTTYVLVFGLLLQHAASVLMSSNYTLQGKPRTSGTVSPLKPVNFKDCEENMQKCVAVEKLGHTPAKKKACDKTGCPWRLDPNVAESCKCYCGHYDVETDYINAYSPYLRDPTAGSMAEMQAKMREELGKAQFLPVNTIDLKFVETPRKKKVPGKGDTYLKKVGAETPITQQVSDYREAVLGWLEKKHEINAKYKGIVYTGAYAAPRHVYTYGMDVATDRYSGVRNPEHQMNPFFKWDEDYTVKDIRSPELGNPVHGFHCTKTPVIAARFAAKNAGQFLRDTTPSQIKEAKPGFLGFSTEEYLEYNKRDAETREAPDEDGKQNKPFHAISDGFVYAVYAEGIEINKVWPEHEYKHEDEILVPGGFSGDEVLGSWRVARDRDLNTKAASIKQIYIGDFVPNPNYNAELPTANPKKRKERASVTVNPDLFAELGAMPYTPQLGKRNEYVGPPAEPSSVQTLLEVKNGDRDWCFILHPDD